MMAALFGSAFDKPHQARYFHFVATPLDIYHAFMNSKCFQVGQQNNGSYNPHKKQTRKQVAGRWRSRLAQIEQGTD